MTPVQIARSRTMETHFDSVWCSPPVLFVAIVYLIFLKLPTVTTRNLLICPLTNADESARLQARIIDDIDNNTRSCYRNR